jgi:hypothetical protein
MSIVSTEGVFAMIAEKYQDADASGEEAVSSVRDYLHRGTNQMTNMVGERPGTSVFTACLLGFGVGLLLSQVIASEDHSYSSSFDRSTAERFGRNLLGRIEHALPAVLRERLMN